MIRMLGRSAARHVAAVIPATATTRPAARQCQRHEGRDVARRIIGPHSSVDDGSIVGPARIRLDGGREVGPTVSLGDDPFGSPCFTARWYVSRSQNAAGHAIGSWAKWVSGC